jgi:uncharacterized protein
VVDTGRLKPSRYNNRLAVNGCVLYHNTLYDSLIAVTPGERERVDAILRRDCVGARALSKELPSYARILTGHGFLIPETTDELAICRELFLHGRDRYPVLTLSIVLGYGCNFSCGYCFQRLTRDVRGTSAVVSDEQFQAFLRFIGTQMDNVQTLDVSWMGGEPLLFLGRIGRFADRLRELCDARGVSWKNLLITNGYLLTAETRGRLRMLPNLKLQVTIDGPRAVHDRRRPHRSRNGSFDEILGNVEACLREGIETHLRINVDEENAGTIPELIEVLDHTEVAHWPGLVHFARVGLDVLPTEPPDIAGYRAFSRRERAFFASKSARPYVKLPELGRTSGCPGLGRRDYQLDPEGRLFKCPRYMHEPAYAVAAAEGGEVREHTSHERWLRWDPFDQPKCTHCSLLPICMGGCPFNAIQDGSESLCGETRHYYKNRTLMQFEAFQRDGGERTGHLPRRRLARPSAVSRSA